MAKYAFKIGDKVLPAYKKGMFDGICMWDFSKKMNTTFVITKRERNVFGNGYEITNTKTDDTMAWIPECLLKKVSEK